MLVFHRAGPPQSLPPAQRDSVGIGREFHRVADAADAQAIRANLHAAQRQHTAAKVRNALVVHAVVLHAPLRRQTVFLPLILNVNQRPLPAAEGEVLNARELKIVVLRHSPSMTSQFSPGSSSSVMS